MSCFTLNNKKMNLVTSTACAVTIIVIIQSTAGIQEYTEWSDFGECSAICGGGVQSRTRACLRRQCDGHLVEMQNCQEEKCRSGMCPDKHPSCKSLKGMCQKKERVRKLCKKTCGSCEDKVSWTGYGPCSVTCGAGLKTRSKGSVTQSITCFMKKCESDDVPRWGPWSSYGPCSASCGGGVSSRSRTCSKLGGCDGQEEETTDCNTEKCQGPNCRDEAVTQSCRKLKKYCSEKKMQKLCQYTCGVCEEEPSWSAYGPCSVTCGAGMKTRTKGAVSESVQCILEKCPEVVTPTWSAWVEVGDCSVTCGRGTLMRTRACSLPDACPGNAVEHVSCETKVCPVWNDWGSWGTCSKSCGVGERSRRRTCTELNGCEGKSDESEECMIETCADSMQWSKCSKSCGGGTRRRLVCNGGDCLWEFEGCGDDSCPQVGCPDLTGIRKYRYNSSHECCTNTHMPVGEECGQQTDEQLESGTERRIIGGVNAIENQWPWIVAVGMDGAGFCAGSLISKKFILTAAHCFAFDSGEPKDFSKWVIYAGILELKQHDPNKALKIAKSYIHPEYSYPIADIALVELVKEVEFSPSIKPICLPHGEETPEEATCIVTGWGVSTVPDAVTNHLQELAITNYDPKVCIHAYGKHEALKGDVKFLKEDKGYICAGSITKAIDSCSGDSGGPLVCQRCNSCSWYIAGVVSFGPDPCALVGVPGVYSKVLYYEDWILRITQMKRHSLSCSTP